VLTSKASLIKANVQSSIRSEYWYCESESTQKMHVNANDEVSLVAMRSIMYIHSFTDDYVASQESTRHHRSLMSHAAKWCRHHSSTVSTHKPAPTLDML